MKYLILSFLFITLSFSAHAEKNVKIQNALDQRAAEFAKTASEGLKKDFAKGVEEVAASGVLDSAKRKGDVAPNIQLNGKNTLYKQLETGPVIRLVLFIPSPKLFLSVLRVVLMLKKVMILM